MELKPGYKHTEIGLIPESWEVAPLGTLATKVASGKFTRKFTFSDYPVYGSTGIIGYSAYPDYEGDAILVARVGANAGRVNFATGRYCVTDNTIIVQMIDRCSLPFYRRQLEAKRLNNLVFGSGQPLITGTQLKAILLPVPPTIEQQTIDTALGDVDALLEGLGRLIAKKRDIKQAAMQQLLTGQTRLPGFSDKWKLMRLCDVAPLQRGFDLPNRLRQSGPYPVVYSNGISYYHKTSRVTGPGVVTGRSGTIGNVTFVEEDYWPHNTSLWVTSFRDNYPKFVFYLYTRLNFGRFASGSGVPTLNRNDVHAFEVLIPPTVGEQTAIAAVLTDMDAEIEALEMRFTKSRDLKQAMMQELLTGKTRLVAPEIAHA